MPTAASATMPFLTDLERQGLHYIIALRQTQPLQRALVEAQGWWPILDEQGEPVEGIKLCRLSYQAATWSAARSVIAVNTSKKGLQRKGKRSIYLPTIRSLGSIDSQPWSRIWIYPARWCGVFIVVVPTVKIASKN